MATEILTEPSAVTSVDLAWNEVPAFVIEAIAIAQARHEAFKGNLLGGAIRLMRAATQPLGEIAADAETAEVMACALAVLEECACECNDDTLWGAYRLFGMAKAVVDSRCAAAHPVLVPTGH